MDEWRDTGQQATREYCDNCTEYFLWLRIVERQDGRTHALCEKCWEYVKPAPPAPAAGANERSE